MSDSPYQLAPVSVHSFLKTKLEASEEKRFLKGQKERQDHDMKHFLSQQKADYRGTKALFKKVSVEV